MPLPSEFNFIGVPGAGKTTALEATVEHAINELGIPPHEIKVVTYRASVAEELKERFQTKFKVSSTDAKDMCCTLHGLASRYYWSQFDDTKKRPEYIDQSWQCWNEFKDEYGHDMRPGGIDSPETNSQLATGYTYFRSTGRNIDEVIERGLYPDPEHILKVSEDLEEFKIKHNLIEFNDCLEYATRDKYVPHASMVLIDEAQDLNPLMTGMIDNFRGKIEYVGLAGDPFQSIYPFYGATPNYLIHFPNSFTLSETRRLHEEHYNLAKKIIAVNTEYIPPDVNTKGTGGKIYYVTAEAAADLTRYHTDGNMVFHLCRTNYLRAQVAHNLANNGIPFFCGVKDSLGWNKEKVNLFNGLNKIIEGKALYYSEIKALRKYTKIFNPLAALQTIKRIEDESKTKDGTQNYRVLMTDAIWNLNTRSMHAVIHDDNNGNLMQKMVEGLAHRGCRRISLLDVFKVRLLTIHAAKGLEAETVFLYTDIPAVVQKGLLSSKTASEEAFVWYVGVSRSLKNLYVVASAGNKYKIPYPDNGWEAI